MEASGSSPAAFFRGRPLRLVTLLAIIAAIVFAVLALTGGDDDDGGGGGTTTVNGPAGNEFTLEVPAGWTEVPADQRQAIPGEPLVVLQREDQQGLIVVNVQPGKVKSFDKQVRVLDRRLKKAIPDFQKVGARIVTVKAGEALLYSYARRERGTAHTLLVVPAGDRSYSLNAAVPAGAKDAAQEVGAILLSFDR
jgi:hypothetical protein